ncbi:MAG: thioredoxin [Firmicutes bacterium]|nr:thioredoxin [Erysipelotrichaceae bacterium]MBR3393652.1 thioredoxin [Bacillota bacterium]
MKIIDKKEFEETIKEGVTLVDFFATWCGPCKMLGPVLEELSEEITDVKFVKIDVDEEPELAEKFGIMSIPSVFLFKDGEVAGSFLGLQPKDKVKAFIEGNK